MKFETTYTSDNQSLLAQIVEAARYQPFITEAAEKYNLQPSIIAGLGSRESHWGLALKPRGPEGTGDFHERKFPAKYRSGSLPPDGFGFGRGLMQIDFDWHEFARENKWKDPRENIFYGCKVLADSMGIIKRRCTSESGAIVVAGYDSERLLCYGLAAYNAGPLAVLTAIRRGLHEDSVTTGGDYSVDVLKRAGWFQAHNFV